MENKKLSDRDVLIARAEKRIKNRRKNIENAEAIYKKMMEKLEQNLKMDLISLNALKNGK